ncbi:MAG TPA: hypothetical protein VM324_15910 [Egibacteraceae bacterium]|nr:hypothetical protein [Egibacteraceae bacterium]
MIAFLLTVASRQVASRRKEDGGFSTAELLGNAALAIAALVAIWGVLQILGLDVVEMIRSQILGGAGG